MKRLCKASDCIWSDQTNFCSALEKASVPLDGKWPLVILNMRSVRDVPFLSEKQKGEMQDILLQVLRDKDFSDVRFKSVQEHLYSIITSSYTEKIQEIARETSELAKDMYALFGKHRDTVSGIVDTVDSNVTQGTDPATLLAGLRDTLKDVVAKMAEDADNLENLSLQDSLTGLANRRRFDAFLDAAVKDWQEFSIPVALMILDIDHFKRFNDTYGHLVGDQVLRTLAKQLLKVTESMDPEGRRILAARFGGEEFVLVLCGELTENARSLAETVRKTVEKTGLTIRDHDNNVVQSGLRVTVSIGVAQINDDWIGAYQTNLVDFADKALYHAKRNGRNRSFACDPTNQEQYIDLSEE